MKTYPESKDAGVATNKISPIEEELSAFAELSSKFEAILNEHAASIVSVLGPLGPNENEQEAEKYKRCELAEALRARRKSFEMLLRRLSELTRRVEL